MTGRHLPGNWEELTEKEQTWNKKRLAMAGQIGWYYEEFGMHLDAMVKENGIMADFCGLLRILDDCKPRYRYDTHKRGNEVIEKPYLALLAALTAADMKPHAQKDNKFWRNGLWPRFIFVCPPKGTPIKRDRMPKGLTYPQELTAPLVRWHQWLGEPEITIDDEFGKDKTTIIKRKIRVITELPERESTYLKDVEDSFYAYDNALIDMKEAGLIPESLRPSYGRLPKIALHVAAILASIDNIGRIEMRHWARARQFVEFRRKDLHELYAQTNATEDDDEPKSLEDEIIRHMTRLSERGQEWVTANGLRGYIKGKERGEIANKLQALDKLKLVEKQVPEKARANEAPKYRLTEKSSEDE